MVRYPLVGILVPNRKMRSIILKPFLYHSNLPMKLFAFAPPDILWERRRVTGLCYTESKWREIIFPFPHAVYNQCYNRDATRTIERLNTIIGSKCFNYINWLNKWEVFIFLNQSNIKKHIPDTFLLNEVNVSELVNKYKLVYIKPLYGRHGYRVYRLELKPNGDTHISLQSLAPRLICRKDEDIQQKMADLLRENVFLVQKGIQIGQIDNKNYDIRALVQKDISGKWTITNKVCRVAHELYFNTGVYESIYDANEFFGEVFPMGEMKENIINSIDRMSIDAAQVLEKNIGLLGELSVDLALDSNMNLWIIEVNGKPQKGIYQDIDNFDSKHLMYRRPLEYAYYLSTH